MKNRKKNRNRPELPRYMTQASVDDETSSTSTESSVGEIEEKVSSISNLSLTNDVVCFKHFNQCGIKPSLATLYLCRGLILLNVGFFQSSSARDSTPEPQHQPKPKKSKRVVKTTGHYDSTIDDADFELTSKSKGHKRIKSKSKDVYGGDIFHPE